MFFSADIPTSAFILHTSHVCAVPWGKFDPPTSMQIARWCGLAAVVGAGTIIFVRLVAGEWAVQTGPVWITPRPWTSLLTLLAGLGMLTCTMRPSPLMRRLRLALAIILAMLSLLLLVAPLAGGAIDRFLYFPALHHWLGALGPEASRMVPGNCVGLVLVSMALAMADSVSRAGRAAFSAVAGMGAVWAGIFVMSYIYKLASSAYGGELYVLMGRVSMTCAAIQLLLSIGLLLARPDWGWMRTLTSGDLGATTARRLLPVVVLVPLVMNYVLIETVHVFGLAPLFGANLFAVVEVVVMLAVMLPITARIGALDVLRTETLEALAEAKAKAALGTLAAGVAHELNNPMMGVMNYVAYAQKSSGNEAATVLAKADRELKRMSGLLRNMLAFAQPEEEATVPTSAAGATDGVLNLISEQLGALGITVERDVSPDLPPVMAKSAALQQVLLSLLFNARDAVENAPVKRIGIAGRQRDGMVTLTVSDSGPGVPKAIRQRIFEPFFTTKPPGRGTGLGLSIARTVMADMGGSLACADGEGEGAAFVITLPAPPSPQNATSTPSNRH